MENWVLLRKGADFQHISEKFHISPRVASLIRNRDVIGDDAIEKYLNGTIADLYDGMLMKDMDKAVAVLGEKIKENAKIRIIGDYDIDGIQSTYILLEGFRMLGADVDSDIPDRMKDGYGLNRNLIDRALEADVDTIITCDNGIAAADQIRLANTCGMTVVVTDHHEVPYEEQEGERIYRLPPAAVVIDPKQEDCPYPYKQICGAVVAYKLIRYLFREAQKQAPCIIFIDEIDAIGKSRDSRFGGGNDEREQTLNQLLAEMDGFDTSKGLLILAATNRPEVLDKALLRPGRFDRRIIVDKPDLKGRLETLKVHSKDVMMDQTVDLDALALATAGLVGSDLANMINEAAINAVKKGRKYVNQADLFEAFELVAVGGKEKKDRVMGDKERKIVSYHEVGHAIVTALQKNTEPVQKITIVPRTMGALGYTLQTPEEEKYLQTKDELLARITTYMAGRAAEMLVFSSATSGAANDIENATAIARAMVTQYGMSDRFGMMCLATTENQYLDNRAGLICGEDTAAQIDGEVLSIINKCYNEAIRLLTENRECLDRIADYLYEHETITGKEFMKIFREIKGIPEPEEEKGKKSFMEQAMEAERAESPEIFNGTAGHDGE